jgi:hypothetical protein
MLYNCIYNVKRSEVEAKRLLRWGTTRSVLVDFQVLPPHVPEPTVH